MGMANGAPAATDSDLRRLEAAIAGIGVHDHLCLIYRTQEEQFAAVVPFIRIGRERGERCVVVEPALVEVFRLEDSHEQ